MQFLSVLDLLSTWRQIKAALEEHRRGSNALGCPTKTVLFSTPQPSFLQSKQAGVLCSLLVGYLCIFLITPAAFIWHLLHIKLILLDYIDPNCTHFWGYSFILAPYSNNNASRHTGNTWSHSSLHPGFISRGGVALMNPKPPKLHRHQSVFSIHVSMAQLPASYACPTATTVLMS